MFSTSSSISDLTLDYTMKPLLTEVQIFIKYERKIRLSTNHFHHMTFHTIIDESPNPRKTLLIANQEAFQMKNKAYYFIG